MSFPDIVPELKAKMPELRGRLLANQALGEFTWFRVGGPAQAFFMPEDENDLAYLLRNLPPEPSPTWRDLILVAGGLGDLYGRRRIFMIGVALFASGVSLWIYRHGAVADPLALGVLPAALVGVGLALLGAAYLLVLGVAFALREKD